MACSTDSDDLLGRVDGGDELAWTELLTRYRGRIRRTIALRLDRRVQARLDPSDVLQEIFLEATQRRPEYLQSRSMPFWLWLRFIATQRVLAIHREHLQSQKRDAAREVFSLRNPSPQASTASLALELIDCGATPSEAAIVTELRQQLSAALDRLPELDRELIALRHFEHLDNGEAAQVLGLNESTASSRYLRALKRLRGILTDMDVMLDL